MKQYIILLILLVSGALTAAPAFAQKSGTKHTVTGKVAGPERRAADRRDRTGDGHDERRQHQRHGRLFDPGSRRRSADLFQYIGYEAKTEKVGARTKVDVKLEQSKQTIDEVVVIGYGTVKKKTALTGPGGQRQDERHQGRAGGFGRPGPPGPHRRRRHHGHDRRAGRHDLDPYPRHALDLGIEQNR